MTEISVVLPAYREAENLSNILPELCAVLRAIGKTFEVLVVDTVEPTDNTAEICRQNGVTCIARENGNMYGDAIRTGIAHAKGRYIVVMDADGSHDPRVIRRMYRVMTEQKPGLVIGSRYCKGGMTDNNAVLRFMSWVLNVTYRVIFGLRVKDVSDSFRMYRAKQLKTLELSCDNFDIVEEILILLHDRWPRARIIEIPISFNKRAAGESKRDLVKFIFSYLQTIRRLLKIRRQQGRRHR